MFNFVRVSQLPGWHHSGSKPCRKFWQTKNIFRCRGNLDFCGGGIICQKWIITKYLQPAVLRLSAYNLSMINNDSLRTFRLFICITRMFRPSFDFFRCTLFDWLLAHSTTHWVNFVNGALIDWSLSMLDHLPLAELRSLKEHTILKVVGDII